MRRFLTLGDAVAALLVATVVWALASPAGAKESRDYIVRSVEPSGLAMQPPELPDISGYTREAALNKIVRRAPGEVRLQRMVERTEFNEFVGSDGRLATWAQRQRQNPVAIVHLHPAPASVDRCVGHSAD